MSGSDDGKTILDMVLDHLVDDEFIDEIEHFTTMHCDKFNNGEENDHQWYEIFKEYAGMFEHRIADYVESVGSSTDEFYVECRELQDKDASYDHFINILISIGDYEKFCEMMLEKKRTLSKVESGDSDSGQDEEEDPYKDI